MPNVKSLNKTEVKKIVKNCPKQVQDYIKALESGKEIDTMIIAQAKIKLKELTKENNQFEYVECIDDNLIDNSLTVGKKYKALKHGEQVCIVNDNSELEIYSNVFFK